MKWRRKEEDKRRSGRRKRKKWELEAWVEEGDRQE